MFRLLTTTKGEKVFVNLDHVVLLCDTKKGIFVSLDNEDSFYCVDGFDEEVLMIQRWQDCAIVRRSCND